MPTPDRQELRLRYARLSDEDLAELHAVGPAAYVPDAWPLLDAEFRARGASAQAAEQRLLAERSRHPPRDAPAATGEEPAVELITVFASGDPARLVVAKLVLQSEGIPFVVTGEGVQDLFGVGRLFGGLNLVTGPVQIRVRMVDAALALASLQAAPPGEPLEGSV